MSPIIYHFALKARQQIRDFCPDLDEQFFSLLKFEFYVKHVD